MHFRGHTTVGELNKIKEIRSHSAATPSNSETVCTVSQALFPGRLRPFYRKLSVFPASQPSLTAVPGAKGNATIRPFPPSRPHWYCHCRLRGVGFGPLTEMPPLRGAAGFQQTLHRSRSLPADSPPNEGKQDSAATPAISRSSHPDLLGGKLNALRPISFRTLGSGFLAASGEPSSRHLCQIDLCSSYWQWY